MARHAAPKAPLPKALRTAGLTFSMAGAALAMAAGGAQAGELDVPAALAGVSDPISNLKVNPLAHTGVDPLDNGVATKVADFPSVGTGMVTGILTQGPSVGELPTAAVSSLLGPVLPKQ
ncbi:hypothetical protein OHA37_14210 [Streptomyces sp. NBC_00335]|uniref:hypothetical protein n=1 Tax=unclassified Streptomyces TaxID=2593676 RepID=UPI0022541FF1|nr:MULTISPECIES: hypothetical protein [unclassified Streptomyces]MCX5405035.1 hypothetical protein [Streptomyces sp. NBC_00086]